MTASSSNQLHADLGREHSVSVLGLGLIGSAIARVFLKNGWKTTVWNRSSSKSEALIAIGATGTSSAAECIAANKLVVTCFLGADDFEAVLNQVEPSHCSGRTIVDFTSGSPLQIQRSQEIASNLSFSAYLRGAIMTTPAYVGDAEVPVYYSGDEEVFQGLKSILKMLGPPRHIDKNVGAAAIYETVMGHCFYGFAGGFVQAMAVLKSSFLYNKGDAARVTDDFLTPLIQHKFPAMFRDLAIQIDEENYLTNGGGSRLEQSVKSLKSMIKSNTAQGLDDIILQPLLKLIEVRVAQGGADEEMSGLVETLQHGATARANDE